MHNAIEFLSRCIFVIHKEINDHPSCIIHNHSNLDITLEVMVLMISLEIYNGVGLILGAEHMPKDTCSLSSSSPTHIRGGSTEITHGSDSM